VLGAWVYDMNWRDAALALAGIIGSGVAVGHGMVVQRRMVRPLKEIFLSDKRMAAPFRRIVPPLLHFSTISWFLGGLALIAASWRGRDARLATGLFVGSLFLFGALGNLWATRGRPHPGWMLMAAALILIAFGIG
jgi:hypothetical protein